MKKYILPAILLAVGAGIAAAASFAVKPDDCCKAAKSCCEAKSDCCKTETAAAAKKDCCQAVQLCCETEADCCGIVNDAELAEP